MQLPAVKILKIRFLFGSVLEGLPLSNASKTCFMRTLCYTVKTMNNRTFNKRKKRFSKDNSNNDFF